MIGSLIDICIVLGVWLAILFIVFTDPDDRDNRPTTSENNDPDTDHPPHKQP